MFNFFKRKLERKKVEVVRLRYEVRVPSLAGGGAASERRMRYNDLGSDDLALNSCGCADAKTHPADHWNALRPANDVLRLSWLLDVAQKCAGSRNYIHVLVRTDQAKVELIEQFLIEAGQALGLPKTKTGGHESNRQC